MAAPGSPGGLAGDPLGPPARYTDPLRPSTFPDVLAGAGSGPDHLGHLDVLAGTVGLVFADVLSTPLPRATPAAGPGSTVPTAGPVPSTVPPESPRAPLTVPSTRIRRPARPRRAALPPGRSRRSERVDLPTWLPDREPGPRHRRGRPAS